MTPTTPSSAYSAMISSRSRRLRTIGAVLLAGILAMCAYGYFVLMPSLHFEQEAYRLAAFARARQGGAQVSGNLLRPLTPAEKSLESPEEARARKVLKAKILFLYGYWSVSGVLLLALLIVGWLDFREITRNYMAQRRAIWTDAIATTNQRIAERDKTARN